MLVKSFNVEHLKIKKKINIRNKLVGLTKEKNDIINSLGNDYKDSFTKKKLKKYKKSKYFRVIGMGGSSLGIKAIYDFLNTKIKKKFYFFDNLCIKKKK